VDGTVLNSRIPKREKTTDYSVDGLKLFRTVTETFEFTLPQLRHAMTVDNIVGIPVTREEVKGLLIGLFKQNRWELFGSYTSPYKIIFNGYGQLKSAECEGTGITLSIDQIFNILETNNER